MLFSIIAKKCRMQLVATNDGSHTLYLPDLDEHYHSTYGAITESLHVFIKAGMEAMAYRPKLTILEVGFGTGLNVLLSCLRAIEHEVEVTYHALEKYPLDRELFGKLNYAAMLSSSSASGNLFEIIHTSPWNETVMLHPGFSLHKILGDATAFIPGFNYDLVYYDAFAPDKQPEMWTPDIFSRLFHNLNPGGMLTTYCAKGTVKRMLRSAGFCVTRLPGPPGKREMLRGVKKICFES